MGVQEEERERAARRLTCGTAAEDGGERNRVGFIWFFFFFWYFFIQSLFLSLENMNILLPLIFFFGL